MFIYLLVFNGDKSKQTESASIYIKLYILNVKTLSLISYPSFNREREVVKDHVEILVQPETSVFPEVPDLPDPTDPE